MSRIISIFSAFILFTVLISSAAVSSYALELADNAPNGVYCEINEVRLFALSEEDCSKAGGEVTHTVTTTVEPVGNSEPEIQRTKDKEPVAP